MLATGTMHDELLSDNKVKNWAGEDLGRVEELIGDPQTGEIDYAVISFGGFLGASDRMFAVPWKTLELDRSRRTFRLRVDRETLRRAPKFSRGEHRHLRRDYLRQVDAHYGQPGCLASC